jgi:hypothetical protein
MRRVLSAALVALALVAGAPAGAHAAPQPTFATSFRGTSVYDFATPGCFVHQVFQARFASSPVGAGRFVLDGCIDLPTLEYDGTFRLDDAAATWRGTVHGDVSIVAGSCRGGVPTDLDFTLTMTAGAPIHRLGHWCAPGLPGVPGAINGTLSAETPSTASGAVDFDGRRHTGSLASGVRPPPDRR